MDTEKLNKTTQNIVKEETDKLKSTVTKEYNFEFDMLQMYYGMDYKVSDNIIIRIPTIGEIIEFGEKRLYAAIMPFIGNTTSYRLQLWDMGIDWNKISDYELFVSLVQGIRKEDSSILFCGDIDFQSLRPYINQENNEIVLMNDEHTLYIDEYTYMHMREYIRTIFDQHPKVEKARGKYTKQAIIDEDRMNLINEAKNSKSNSKSIYLPLISALLNHPGFKYKKNELKEVNIVEFMDSVKRLQVYESTTALLSGMYSGMVDTSKIDKNEFNWMRDIY